MSTETERASAHELRALETALAAIAPQMPPAALASVLAGDFGERARLLALGATSTGRGGRHRAGESAA